MRTTILKKMCLAGIVLTTVLGIKIPANDDDSESRIRQGYSIAPVPLDLQGKNRALIGLGSYLVNGAGGCFGCHTIGGGFLPGGSPFNGEPAMINVAAYLGGGRAFGPFVSRNLTPDAEGLPAGLTLGEFKEVMRHGTDLKNLAPPVPSPTLNLLQVMPWPDSRHMTDQDLQAIYEYLTAVPCLEGGPGMPPSRCG
jgi:hypothetical protein